MTCASCEELRLRVTELEEQLDLRISLPDRIYRALPVSMSESHLLAALCNAKRWLPAIDLDAEIPVAHYIGSRIDPDMRQTKTINVWIYNIRRKIGKNIIDSRKGRGGGFALSLAGRELIRQALEKDSKPEINRRA